MYSQNNFAKVRVLFFVMALISGLAGVSVSAQTGGKALYDQIKAFPLTGGKADVANLTLKRDRVAMTFTGTFYFAAPIDGRVTGAVFIGKGTMHAEVPPSSFEKANVRRLLKADAVASDFNSAVFRFTDDTYEALAATRQDGPATAEAQKMAAEFDPRTLKQTGANISSRLTLSILNNEKPGFFFASFKGGQLGEFNYVFDAQTRVPTANFNLNGGEKGIIYAYKQSIFGNEIWMAFYGLADYERGSVEYSDQNDLVDIIHYDLDLDLRNPKSRLGLNARMAMKTRTAGVRAITFVIGESLGEGSDERLKKQMRITSAKMGGAEIEKVQEDWEGGVTVFLPSAPAAGADIELEMAFEGDFMRQPEIAGTSDFSYPRATSDWYPRHGYLDRSTVDATFVHPKRFKIASVGMRQSEAPFGEEKDVMVTKYKMTEPIALTTFAIGPFQRFEDKVKWEGGDKEIPLEYNSVPGGILAIKESFMLAELSNSIRYFNQLFGAYPYENFSATFHPYGFGQGFPSMLMIPATDRANKYTYSFMSHETAHQWWGNIVAWRSYRDQWLSEGFAEYSGVLYTAIRQNPKAAQNLIEQMRDSLRRPPETLSGIGKGTLNDVGPLILGHRLSTSKTFGGYESLVYNKGGLVLRMLHFLMTNPSDGNGQPFFDMMRDFVTRYRNKTASTDDFRLVANEHFAKTPIAQKYHLQDLNWFFQQWVYESDIPEYTLEYKIEDQPDGSVLLTGNLRQENVSDHFFMPLPLNMKFSGGKEANGTIYALGPNTPFKIKLASRPDKVELDPNLWILSSKTSTK